MELPMDLYETSALPEIEKIECKLIDTMVIYNVQTKKKYTGELLIKVCTNAELTEEIDGISSWKDSAGNFTTHFDNVINKSMLYLYVLTSKSPSAIGSDACPIFINKPVIGNIAINEGVVTAGMNIDSDIRKGALIEWIFDSCSDYRTVKPFNDYTIDMKALGIWDYSKNYSLKCRYYNKYASTEVFGICSEEVVVPCLVPVFHKLTMTAKNKLKFEGNFEQSVYVEICRGSQTIKTFDNIQTSAGQFELSTDGITLSLTCEYTVQVRNKIGSICSQASNPMSIVTSVPSFVSCQFNEAGADIVLAGCENQAIVSSDHQHFNGNKIFIPYPVPAELSFCVNADNSYGLQSDIMTLENKAIYSLTSGGKTFYYKDVRPDSHTSEFDTITALHNAAPDFETECFSISTVQNESTLKISKKVFGGRHTTDYMKLLENYKAASPDIVDELIEKIEESSPKGTEDMMYYKYGLDPAGCSVDLKAGMRLKVGYSIYQMLPEDESVSNGYVGTGEAFYSIVERDKHLYLDPFINTFSSGKQPGLVIPAPAFDPITGIMPGASGVCDLLHNQMDAAEISTDGIYTLPVEFPKRYMRLVYPKTYLSRKSKGAASIYDNICIITADNYGNLLQATSALRSAEQLPGSVCVTYFRGRVSVTPMISVFINASLKEYPVGTLLKDIMNEFGSSKVRRFTRGGIGFFDEVPGGLPLYAGDKIEV